MSRPKDSGHQYRAVRGWCVEHAFWTLRNEGMSRLAVKCRIAKEARIKDEDYVDQLRRDCPAADRSAMRRTFATGNWPRLQSGRIDDYCRHLHKMLGEIENNSDMQLAWRRGDSMRKFNRQFYPGEPRVEFTERWLRRQYPLA